MSIPDSLIIDYFELVTDVPDEEIAGFKEQLSSGKVNPMEIKKKLAYEIVKQFHGKKSATEAEEYFAKVFQKREMPEKVSECFFPAKYMGNELYQIDITPTLVRAGIVKSNSELKRLIAQKAVELDSDKINSNIINARHGSILRVGRRTFVKIVVK
jgi:tyrosyl-tRNA synthetase